MASSLRQRKTFDDAAGPPKGSWSVKSGCRLCRLLGAAVFNIRLHLVYQARSRGMSARMQTFARACFGVFPSSASASKGWQRLGRRRGALLCEDARPGPRNPASARVFPRFSLPGWFSGAANSLSFQAHSNFFDASAPCAYPRLPRRPLAATLPASRGSSTMDRIAALSRRPHRHRDGSRLIRIYEPEDFQSA